MEFLKFIGHDVKTAVPMKCYEAKEKVLMMAMREGMSADEDLPPDTDGICLTLDDGRVFWVALDPNPGKEYNITGGIIDWGKIFNEKEIQQQFIKDARFNFSNALTLLKGGKYICREGWNGKGVYIFFIGVDFNTPGLGGWTYTNGKNDNYGLSPFIAMKTADNKVVPWLASQTDILANDWMVTDNI